MQGLKQIIDHNVNVNKTKLNNVNVKPQSVPINLNGNDVHRIASYIADKLHDYGSLMFFCKVAWQIPEHTLMLFLEQAERGHSPARYFTWLCNQELRKLNRL